MGKTFPRALCNRGSGGSRGAWWGLLLVVRGLRWLGCKVLGSWSLFLHALGGKKKCLHPHLNTLLKIFSFALKAGGRLGCWLMFFPSFPF